MHDHNHIHIHDIDPLEKSMLNRTAGDKHHMRELQKLEAMLYHGFDVESWYNDLAEYLDKQFPEGKVESLTVKDFLKIDTHIKAMTIDKLDLVEQTIVRAFAVGHLLNLREQKPMPRAQEMPIEELPARMKDAMKRYSLSPREAASLMNAQSHAAQHLVSATNTTVNRVQSLVSDSIIKGTGRKQLKQALFDEFTDDRKEINRNFQRVAITETSYSFNNGYLATMKGMQWLVGISMPDRCEHCGSLIDGKVYPYIETTNEAMRYDNLTPGSKEYERRAWIAAHCIWLNKDNYGRSGAKRKKTAEGMKEREDHEKYVPAIPVHPLCRCRYFRLNPELQFVNSDGVVMMKAMNPEGWKKWHAAKIEPIRERLIQYGIIK